MREFTSTLNVRIAIAFLILGALFFTCALISLFAGGGDWFGWVFSLSSGMFIVSAMASDWISDRIALGFIVLFAALYDACGIVLYRIVEGSWSWDLVFLTSLLFILALLLIFIWWDERRMRLSRTGDDDDGGLPPLNPLPSFDPSEHRPQISGGDESKGGFEESAAADTGEEVPV